MITRKLIEQLPDEAIVVNSSRGPAIDQQALLDHVLDGRLYAALDVYDPEPPSFDADHLEAPNLLLSPHVAGDTAEGHLALAGYVLADVLEVARRRQSRSELRRPGRVVDRGLRGRRHVSDHSSRGVPGRGPVRAPVRPRQRRGRLAR